MKVDIAHLEDLSKLKIDEDKKEQFAADLGKILDFVDEITTLDLPTEDKSKAVGLAELRSDEVKPSKNFDPLANAPKQKDGCYLVPLVVE